MTEGELRLRVPILSAPPRLLVVEHPALEGQPLTFDPGTPLDVCIGLQGSGAACFTATVRGPWLADGGSPALALHVPPTVEIAQRRAAFRVGLPVLCLVTIRPVGGDGGCAGELADISETGCGVLVDASAAADLPDAEHRLSFRLPDEPDTRLELAARPIRRQPQQGGRVRIGWRFEARGQRLDPAHTALARFIARVQRGRVAVKAV